LPPPVTLTLVTPLFTGGRISKAKPRCKGVKIYDILLCWSARFSPNIFTGVASERDERRPYFKHLLMKLDAMIVNEELKDNCKTLVDKDM